jgi:hypothetical protein
MNRSWLLAVPLFLAISGCAGSSDAGGGGEPNLVYSVDLTSDSSNLKSLNSGTLTTGWNHLVGTTIINGQNANVELLGSVAYTNGNGPFFGFLNVTLEDGSILTTHLEGTAIRPLGSTVTTFKSEMQVLGGTGTYNDSTGTGSFVGSRDSALGGAVHLDVRVTVH